ncbi:MAG: hypothetical protein NWF00_10700 [Candidatus Bathyarchaeota archaeon]|nr:hypothetical protein [Candidatus Bathyarchaeota archaeon]
MREDNLKTFMGLGLTYQQAKIYLATYDLCTSIGAAPIKLIAKTSATARQNVNQTMLSLQELDLVEKILESPPKFKPLPLKKAAEMLLNKKRQQLQTLKTATKKLSEKTEHEYVFEENCELVLIPKGEAHRRRIFELIDGAQEGVKSIMTLPMSTFWSPEDIPDSLQKAIDRGVEVQILSNQPKKVQNEHETVSPRKRDFCEVRYSKVPLPVMCCLVDQRELFLNLETNRDPTATCVLCTNNFGIITIVDDYFCRAWQKADPI